jgi:poly(3-hydroxybutyrate) depolymerase
MVSLLRSTTAVMLLLGGGQAASGKVFDKDTTVSGTPVHYKLVLPKDYDAEKAYPGVLAFPPGAQTADMVLTTLERNFRAEAERRGYIVVIPAAPLGRLFSEEGARVFPDFLTQLLAEYKIRDNKFHVAGMSNGGLSAFHIAASYPQYFWSVTGFPGYLQDATPERVGALAKICINMHVGEFDTGWLVAMKAQAEQFRAQGYTVRFTVEKGESHVLSSLTGMGAARLFNQFEEARMGCAK